MQTLEMGVPGPRGVCPVTGQRPAGAVSKTTVTAQMLANGESGSLLDGGTRVMRVMRALLRRTGPSELLSGRLRVVWVST